MCLRIENNEVTWKLMGDKNKTKGKNIKHKEKQNKAISSNNLWYQSKLVRGGAKAKGRCKFFSGTSKNHPN